MKATKLGERKTEIPGRDDEEIPSTKALSLAALDALNAAREEAQNYAISDATFRQNFIRLCILVERKASATTLACSGLLLDRVSHVLECTRTHERVLLDNREFQLMAYMMDNDNRPLSRDSILQNAWDLEPEAVSKNLVDVYVTKLRQVIQQITHEPPKLYIRCIIGLGYEFGRVQE